MTAWTMYWITRLDYCMYFSVILLVFGFVNLFIWGFALGGEIQVDQHCRKISDGRYGYTSKDLPNYVTGFYLGLISIIAAIPLLVFVPTEKDMYKIIIVPKILNNEVIRSDCKDLYDLAVSAMKEKLTTTKGEKNE